MNKIKILDWRPLSKGALLGFVKIELPSGLIISDVTILDAGRGPWANPPAKPMIDRSGFTMKDEAGKLRYATVIEFATKDHRKRFSDLVVEELRSVHPEVFA